jgi:hypothetical protein
MDEDKNFKNELASRSYNSQYFLSKSTNNLYMVMIVKTSKDWASV